MNALGLDPQFRNTLFSIFAYDAATGYRFGLGFEIKRVMKAWAKSHRSSSRQIGTAISSAIANVDGSGGVQALNAAIQIGDFALHLNAAVTYYDRFITQFKAVIRSIKIKPIQEILTKFSGSSGELVQNWLDAGNDLYPDATKYPASTKNHLIRMNPVGPAYPYAPSDGTSQGFLLGQDVYMNTLMCGFAVFKVPMSQVGDHPLTVTAKEVFEYMEAFYTKNQNPPLEDFADMMQGNLEECISIGVAQCGADLLSKGLGFVIENGGKAFLDQIKRNDIEAREARGDTLTSCEKSDLWNLRHDEYSHLSSRAQGGEPMTPEQQAKIDAHQIRIQERHKYEQQQRFLVMGSGSLHHLSDGASIIDEDGNLKSGKQNPFTDPTSVFYKCDGKFDGVSAIFGDRAQKSFAGFVDPTQEDSSSSNGAFGGGGDGGNQSYNPFIDPISPLYGMSDLNLDLDRLSTEYEPNAHCSLRDEKFSKLEVEREKLTSLKRPLTWNELDVLNTIEDMITTHHAINHSGEELQGMLMGGAMIGMAAFPVATAVGYAASEVFEYGASKMGATPESAYWIGIAGSLATGTPAAKVLSFGGATLGKALTSLEINTSMKVLLDNSGKLWKPGEVWGMGFGPRGNIIEKFLGQNLPQSFKTIDKFNNGVVTSIKSLDVNAMTYQTVRNLENKVKGYVDKVAGFKDGRLGTRIIESQDVTARALDLAIPHAGNSSQQVALQRVLEYAASKNIQLNVIIIP